MADLATDPIADDLDIEIWKHHVSGISTRAIMRRYSLSKRDVESAIDRTLTSVDPKTRARMVRLQFDRIETLIRPFFADALTGNTAAANTLIKFFERQSALLGLDAPVKIDAVLVESYDNPSSTQELEAAINLLVGKPSSQPH